MDKLGDFIDGQKWIAPVETALGAVADTVLNKKQPILQKVRNWLGGHLVYNERIGINHAPEELPDKFTAIMPEADLREGKLHKAEVKEIPVVLLKRKGRIYVMAEKCSHLGGPMSEGKVVGDAVVCPWHDSKFALEDGRVIDGPATYTQPCFEVRVRKGQIQVRAPRGIVANPY